MKITRDCIEKQFMKLNRRQQPFHTLLHHDNSSSWKSMLGAAESTSTAKSPIWSGRSPQTCQGILAWNREGIATPPALRG